jgi:hypothetical protein
MKGISLAMMGTLSNALWWRFVLFCLFAVLELHLTMAVVDPIPYILSSRTIHEKILLLRHLFVSISIGLSQIGPYLSPVDNRSMREILVQLENVTLQETSASDERLRLAFSPFHDDLTSHLKKRIEIQKVEETLERDPEFLEAFKRFHYDQ